jgi:hypothetical protein
VILPGWDVRVPIGQVAGGGNDPLSSFQYLPGCQRSSPAAPMPVGCVVAYSSYRQPEGQPPVFTGLFGHSTIPGHQVLCVNPAALLAGRPSDQVTTLDAYFGTQQLLGGSPLGPLGVLASFLSGWTIPAYPTGFAHYPQGLAGGCRFHTDWSGNWSWLNISGSGQFPAGVEYSQFGTHNVDVSLALGNLTALVAAQSQAWLAAHR